MPKTIDFIFDFASPNAYFAYRLLPGIVARTGATVTIVPCLLGGIFKLTGNQAPFIRHGPVKGKLDYTRLELKRFIDRHGLHDFKMNPHFPVNTVMMMRGALVAQQQGRLDEYVEAGLKFMWEDGLKLDDTDVFAEAMTGAGFDGADLLKQVQREDIKKQLIDNTSAAVERGVFGVPTFFVGGEMFFGKDRLDQVEAELLT